MQLVVIVCSTDSRAFEIDLHAAVGVALHNSSADRGNVMSSWIKRRR